MNLSKPPPPPLTHPLKPAEYQTNCFTVLSFVGGLLKVTHVTQSSVTMLPFARGFPIIIPSASFFSRSGRDRTCDCSNILSELVLEPARGGWGGWGLGGWGETAMASKMAPGGKKSSSAYLRPVKKRSNGPRCHFS